MIRNYFLTAWRNLLRNKLYSALNIGGLAIGMAVSFLLLLYVYNEFTYDGTLVNSDRTYKVMINRPADDGIHTAGETPAPLAAAMVKDYPEIENVARTNNGYDILTSHGDVNVKLNFMAADPAVLDIFTFNFVKGDKQKALSGASSVIITQSGAKALFGNADPIGKVIRLNDAKLALTVSAVIKDHPANSSIKFKMLIPWEAYTTLQPWVKTAEWGNYTFATIAVLKPGASVTAFNKKLKDIVTRYDPENAQNQMFLYPRQQLHLYGEFKNGVSVGGKIEQVRLFLYLAIGILLVACINFMNLSTARSERRAREVGVRKAIGARRLSLVNQFLSESVLMAFVALLLAVILMLLLLPLFSQIVGTLLYLPYKNVFAWLCAIGVTLITGLIAGSYPAVFLSSFKPVRVLKGQLLETRATITPRKVLVVTQFTFAICLILSSLFIYKQINYIKNRPLGYNNKGLLEMDMEGDMYSRFEDFRRDAISTGAIVDGASTSGGIVNSTGTTWGVTWPGQLAGEEKLPIDQIAVGYNFTNTYGLEIVKGRDFDKARLGDSLGLMLNEAAVNMMRLKNPLGAQIKWQGENRIVVGVVKDFVWGSPYEPVKPAIIGFLKEWAGTMALKLNPERPVSESLAKLARLYKKYNPQYTFEYKFTDERFDSKFKTEKLLGTMATSFTSLAIIISCLGLFGLASFSAEQRRKEMGIRKVLGAKTAQLWLKLSQEFVQLVLISFVIGAAISWYGIDGWLNNYTYHTSLSLWVFAVTMVASVTLCLLTVSWQAIRAAWANPVKSLRSE